MEPNIPTVKGSARLRGLAIIVLGLAVLLTVWWLRGPTPECEHDAVGPWQGTQSDCDAAQRIQRLRPKLNDSMLANTTGKQP